MRAHVRPQTQRTNATGTQNDGCNKYSLALLTLAVDLEVQDRETADSAVAVSAAEEERPARSLGR